MNPEQIESIAEKVAYDLAESFYGFYNGDSTGSRAAMLYFAQNWKGLYGLKSTVDRANSIVMPVLIELAESHRAELERIEYMRKQVEKELKETRKDLSDEIDRLKELYQESGKDLEAVTEDAAAIRAELAETKAKLEDIHTKDSIKTREINLLVQENREQHAQLRETKAKLATLDETNHGLFKDLLAQQDLNAKLREALKLRARD